MGSRYLHLRGVDLSEGEGAGRIDYNLDVDLADAIELAPVERVLIKQLAGRRRSAWPGRTREYARRSLPAPGWGVDLWGRGAARPRRRRRQL